MENLNISLELNSNQADNSIVSVLVDDMLLDQITISTSGVIKKNIVASMDSGDHKLRLLVDPQHGNVISIRSIGFNGQIFSDTDNPLDNRYLKTHGFFKFKNPDLWAQVTFLDSENESIGILSSNFGYPGEFYLPFRSPIVCWLLEDFPFESGELFDMSDFSGQAADYDPDSGLTMHEYTRLIRSELV